MSKSPPLDLGLPNLSYAWTVIVFGSPTKAEVRSETVESGMLIGSLQSIVSRLFPSYRIGKNIALARAVKQATIRFCLLENILEILILTN